MAQLVVLPGGVLVDRAVVVHPGLDPGLAQPVSHPVAVLKPGREQVIDAGALRPLLHDHGVPREQLPVVLSAGAPRLVPGVEVLELDSQQCRLEPVEPFVEAELHVLALDPLAEVAQTAEPAGQQRVVGADSAAVSKRAEVLARVEREAGRSLPGRRAGALGAAAGFSFYPGKNLGALGDGGAVCTDDALLASRLRRLRNLGQRVKGEHVELGFNERLDGLQAALLRVKLEYLDEWNDARRARAEDYRELLPRNTVVMAERPESPCIYHLFPARFDDRDRMAGLLRDAGIETGVHYDRAVHEHAAWDDHPLRHGDLPIAEAWAAQELSLPMHSDLTRMEVERVAHAIETAGAGRGHQ